MMITRLLDREDMYGQKNIGFEALMKNIRETNESLANKIQGDLQSLRNEADKIKTMRHKYIAHSDYELNIDIEEMILIKPKIQEINLVLEKISELMNVIISEYEHRPRIAFNKFSMSHDGTDILNYIKNK